MEVFPLLFRQLLPEIYFLGKGEQVFQSYHSCKISVIYTRSLPVEFLHILSIACTTSAEEEMELVSSQISAASATVRLLHESSGIFLIFRK